MPDLTRIRVATDAPYDVLVGRNLFPELPPLLGEQVQRVAIIHPEAVASTASRVEAALTDDGYRTFRILVPDAERAKTSTVAATCWEQLGRAGFTRSDAVVGVGGGSTTDLAGFVAATFLRGLRVVQVPTTLLGMVDAAVGGKTGINTGQGKNLVGAFHEPAGVICDLTSLDTLDPADLVSGLAEVVKCGFVADERILTLIEADPAAAAQPAAAANRQLIEAAIRVKAEVVAGDLKESTSHGRTVGREALNYGHTFGHAVEQAEEFTVRHGEAVAIGLVYVAELARLAGRLDPVTSSRHREILDSLGLPTGYRGASWDMLHAAMRVDKKSRGDVLRFVIIEAVGRPAILSSPKSDQLVGAYQALRR